MTETLRSGHTLSASSKARVVAVSLANILRSRTPQISLITDFGRGDESVYAVKSAALAVNPKVQIVDICHDVPLGNILVGAARLARNVALSTEDGKSIVYVAVVDPGVGTERKNIIVRTQRGRYLVGPDNGVLSLAFIEGIDKVVEITNRNLTLLERAESNTFHGKDIFAPVAAHILRGVPIEEFGSKLAPQTLVKIRLSSQSSTVSRSGFIVNVDGVGSIRTNLPNHVPPEFIGKELGFRIRGKVRTCGSRGQEEEKGFSTEGRARLVRTFGEVESGEPVLILGSTGNIDLAVRDTSAARRFGIDAESLTLDEGLRPALKIEITFPSN
ncbi:SAM-dependent chlorinase/fluorinase [Candidatus Micrarchaeota archaeon]|nr:SAM-dependent chlorinase/fluorinase [Candidatus Micrarchaeota archaeon]